MVQETGSDLAAALWDGCNHDLTADDLDIVEQAWERYWAATYLAGGPRQLRRAPTAVAATSGG